MKKTRKWTIFGLNWTYRTMINKEKNCTILNIEDIRKLTFLSLF